MKAMNKLIGRTVHCVILSINIYTLPCQGIFAKDAWQQNTSEKLKVMITATSSAEYMMMAV